MILPAFALVLAAASGGLDPLVEKAFSHADGLEKVRENISMTTTTRKENLRSDGRVDSVEESVTRFTRVKGVETRVIVRATKDGREQTPEEREEAAKESGIGKKFSLESPFRRAHRARHAFKVVGPEAATGAVRVNFAPLGEEDTHTNLGYALVDPATGAMRRLEFHPSELPMYIQKLNVVMEFDPKTPERPMPIRLNIDAEGGLLFVKRTVRTVTTFTEFEASAPKSP